ncbi:hypothetical protein VSS74_21275 [Conexibacter stalactiti]|uniref:Uncharacterized protein n=1 Tax=Conexibacter stalactiti TaxID=1940611 RepID=A0ABU4HUG3_9ACTN|nr:hypothetical protein [Conexibacter stalactiti]MDW5596893.1 hypothetical protein [Conexibacter stalactiti]MEC5037535.1 hypothetical protein [Conexibacter stalactiti]
MPSSCRPALWLLAALCALALVPTAAQAGFVAFGRDPGGDSGAPEAGRDLLAAGVGYDRGAGELVTAIELRGAPRDGGAFVTVLVARRTATGCDGAPAAGFSSLTDETSARWLRFASPTEVTASGDASKRGGTATVRVRLGERAARTTDLRVDVSAGRLKATETRRISVRTPTPAPPPSRGGGGDGGDSGPSRVCTRWFPDISGETGGSLGLVPC